MKISCIIIDDEPLALELLERYVLKTPFLELKHSCKSAIEAMDIINNEQIDLLFLDIQMPDLTGIEFSKIVGKKSRIIFTTAFSEYALEGFKHNAIDYLLKPFNYEEFLGSVNKAFEWFEIKRKSEIAGKTEKDDYLFVKSEYRRIKIEFDEVLYFEGMKDYIKIWLKDNPKPVLTILSLKALLQKLPDKRFMRVHRSYIIAFDKIESVERNQAIMLNGTRITIADQYKSEFHSYIERNTI